MKIDMGVHVDGYIAVVAHTLQVPPAVLPDRPPPPPDPVTGPRANVMLATYTAADIAVKLIKAGNKNKQVKRRERTRRRCTT